MNDEPVLLREPREGVPQVTDTLEGFEDYCDRLSAASGPLAADAERASGYRYGHDDWLINSNATAPASDCSTRWR